VARRVDQVELVGDPVGRSERQAHALRLDGDAALLLELHAVEQLRLLLAIRDHAGDLEDAVGQRALAVVDVRDDAEITDECGVMKERS
jgi:hypothetical protein